MTLIQRRVPSGKNKDSGLQYSGVALKALKYVNINQEMKRFFQSEIMINVSVSSFLFI